MAINKEKLRKDLKEEYEAAMFGDFPAAITDISRVERASEEELVKMAEKQGINIKKYEK